MTAALREFEVRFLCVVRSARGVTIRLEVNSGGVRVRRVEGVIRRRELESSGRHALEGSLLHALCADAARRAELVIRCSARALDAPMQVRPWLQAALDDEVNYREQRPIGTGSVVRRFVAAAPSL